MGQDGEEYPVLTLGQAPATASERRAALVVIVLFAVVTLGVATHAHVRGPALILPGFLPAFALLTALTDALAAYLLWGQARAGEEPAVVVVLAVTYLASAVWVAVHAWLFPAAFLVAGRAMAAATWLGVLWQLLFAAGVTAYALYPSAWSPPRHFSRSARDGRPELWRKGTYRARYLVIRGHGRRWV